MNEESPDDILRRKFPDLKPIKSAPSLFRWNGFGLGMAGKRGYDNETGTWVTTHCITALFIPLLALGSYRVAAAHEGWIFLGKEKTSQFAKIWNILFVVVVVTGISLAMVSANKNSPEYLGEQSLAEAKALEDEGNLLDAAAKYRDHLVEDLPRGSEAVEGINRTTSAVLKTGNAAEVLQGLSFLGTLPPSIESQRIGESIEVAALGAATRLHGADPAGAYEIVDHIWQDLNVTEELPPFRRELLETLVARKPADQRHVIDYAEVLLMAQQPDDVLAVLDPLQESLGTGEGARIYGQALVAAGRATEATTYLQRYIEPRLKDWRNSRQRFNSQSERSYQQELDSLNQGKGADSFYRKHQAAASEADKAQLVDEYIFERLERNDSYQQALRQYQESTAIVPVIMDLGIAQLRSGQSAPDPKTRKELLDDAEKTFLSLQESEGNSDSFRFFLGQVYYWSGKQEEGKKLFEDLLTSSGRDFQTLATISQTLREVGSETEARKLSEEAFEKATNPEQKTRAAIQRSVMSIDIDDELAWLQKVPDPDHVTAIRLASAQAEKANQDGDKEKALGFYRTAAEGWGKLPSNATTLNNGALVQWRLFSLTGELSHYENGTKMMEQAVALEPDDSILVFNAATALLSNAVLQIAKDSFHPRLIQAGIDLDSLRFLYLNGEQREALFGELTKNAHYRRGLELLQRSLVLAPNNLSSHRLASHYYSTTQNLEALQALLLKVEDTEFPSDEPRAKAEEYWKGEQDEDIRKSNAIAEKEWTEIHAELTDPKQKAYARVALAETRLSLFSLGDPSSTTLETEMAALKTILEQHPSSRVRGAYLDARSQHALIALSSQNQQIAGYLKSGRRNFGARQLIAYALYSDSLRPLVLAHVKCKQVLNDIHEHSSLFPKTADPDDWFLATHLAPDSADEVKANALKNQTGLLSGQFLYQTTPWSPSSIMNQYQSLHLKGEDEKANALLKQAAEDNISLPKL